MGSFGDHSADPLADTVDLDKTSTLDSFFSDEPTNIKENIGQSKETGGTMDCVASCEENKPVLQAPVIPGNLGTDIILDGNDVMPHRHNKPKKAHINLIVPQGNCVG